MKTKQELMAEFERGLMGHFDVEKDNDRSCVFYTNLRTQNMYASFLNGYGFAMATKDEQ